MAFYIKVPPLMAKEMGLGPDAKLPDGNSVSMITQFRKYCPTFVMEERIPSMGCAILRPWELPLERSGQLCKPLPEPTDPEFMRYARTEDDAAEDIILDDTGTEEEGISVEEQILYEEEILNEIAQELQEEQTEEEIEEEAETGETEEAEAETEEEGGGE